MIGYSFLVRATMKEPAGWKKRFLTEFVHEEGSTVGTKLIGHGVPWWDRDRGFQTLDELVRWSRWCFIYERDAPKFTHLGKEIPHWCETKESWAEYKHCDHSKKEYGTFYTALYTEPLTGRGKTPKCTGDVLERTAGRCGLCFDPIETEGPRGEFSSASDHIYPDSKGGSDAIENIQATHSCCNGSKKDISGGHAPLAWMLGRFALNQLASPRGLSTWKSLAGEVAKATRKFIDRF
jgi:5-methylcytosine-specific restriction endonuclease McrA